MSLYARSDLASVSVSADAHGGCGAVHTRPAPGGVPVQPWKLDCPSCEEHLRHDPQWAVTPSEIPETHDETKAREDFERRGAKDKDALMVLIMAKSVGIDPSQLPESLTRMVTGQPLHVPGMLECANGHPSPPGQKFCGECGSPMSSPVTKAALDAPQRPAGPAADAAGREGRAKPPRLRDARLDQLQALARTKGISDEGTRADLIGRLKGAGAVGADLLRLPVAA